MGLAMQGIVTGNGPSNSKEKALLRLTGWQPYSVKIGNSYYSYAWLDPFSTIAGVSADMIDAAKSASNKNKTEDDDQTKIEKIASMVFASVLKNILSKLSLRGASDLIQAASNPDRYGDNYIQNLSGTLIPSVVAQTARTMDPVLRQTRTVADSFKNRIPFLKETLFPIRDVWGEPIASEGSLGPDMLSPVYETQLNNDPVNRRLTELRYFPSRPEREIRGVELSDKQYDDFCLLAGHTAKMRLETMISVNGFQNLPPKIQVKMAKDIIDQSRETASGVIMMRNPDLVKKAYENKMKQVK